jgi:transcriptional regulator with XRE-family HTH domain
MTLKEAVGQRIRVLRKDKGYSQEGFADHCNLHRTFMSSLERGEHNVSLGTLHKIAQGLRISLSELLKGVDQR